MDEATEMFFISYASNDRIRARALRERLQRDFSGVKFWFDREDIPPGSEWKLEIEKAIRSSIGMILLLSSHSVKEEGYVQKEFRWAVERAEEMPEGHSFLFWVRLDDVETPTRLDRWQGCDIIEGEGDYHKLKQALAVRLGQVRGKKPAKDDTPPHLRTIFLATEQRLLKNLADAYRGCTRRDLQRRSGPLPAFDLGTAQGAARLLLFDHHQAQFATLEQQIYLFRPDRVVVLGLGMTRNAGSTNPKQLIVPSRVYGYSVQAVSRRGVRDFELVPHDAPYLANVPLEEKGLLPDTSHKVGVISRDMELSQLRRQIADTDLDIVELADGGLFPVVAGCTRNWMLLSAIAGSFYASPAGLDSAAYTVAEKVMKMLAH